MKLNDVKNILQEIEIKETVKFINKLKILNYNLADIKDNYKIEFMNNFNLALSIVNISKNVNLTNLNFFINSLKQLENYTKKDSNYILNNLISENEFYKSETENDLTNDFRLFLSSCFSEYDRNKHNYFL